MNHFERCYRLYRVEQSEIHWKNKKQLGSSRKEVEGTVEFLIKGDFRHKTKPIYLIKSIFIEDCNK
jgi:hypothetical protein